MLHLTEIKLPLDHPDEAIEDAILKRLAIPAGDLIRHVVLKRGVDARKKHHIQFT